MLFNEHIMIPEHLPAPDKNRLSTDVCCTIISAIFALTMFIVACCLWNKDAFNDRYFNNIGPDGKNCQDGFVLVFTNPDDLSARTCSQSCPYRQYQSQGVCIPQDATQRDRYFGNSDFTRQWDYNGMKQTLFYATIIAIGFGLLWLVFVHCAPRIAPIAALVGSIILLLAIGILLILASYNYFGTHEITKITIAVCCFILMIIMIAVAIYYSYQIIFQGTMLAYAVRFLNDNPSIFMYIPIFMIFTLGLIALIVWQHCCFSSNWASNRNFWDFSNSGFWGVMNILEFIWGLQFLRDAFNFCVSGAAVDWYWTGNCSCYTPYQRLVCNNWGSVVGGSFLNAFFQIPTLIVEFFVCHPTTCCGKCGTFCYNSCTCCTGFFNLVRTDAYSYINLTGIPFCNSARQCQMLCDHSRQFVGSHSPMKHYRFAAHVFCVASVILMTYFILKYRVLNYGFWNFAIGCVVILATITWFIHIHADAAQGLQTSYLAENQLEDYPYMQKILPNFRKELEHLENKQKGDGNC